MIFPGGGIARLHHQWKRTKGKYLFNAFALASVFRARLLAEFKKVGLSLPAITSGKWVVDCRPVGKGSSVLNYLARYLYRGVLSEKNIVANKNGEVTFKYIKSDNGENRFRTLKGMDFLYVLLQHVLPRGFRRVRDYGFLHGNAKKILCLIQLLLHVKITYPKPRPRPTFKCSLCQAAMFIISFRSYFDRQE